MLTACKQLRLKKDSQIASEIVSEYGGGDKIKLYYTNLGELNYIQLYVFGSTSIHQNNYTKDLLASYYATQLYKRLDPKTINKNTAIQILFDNEDDGYLTNIWPHFYPYKEIQAAWKAFYHIEGLLNAGINNSIGDCLSHLDSNYSSDSVQIIVKNISNAINKPVLKYNSFYQNYFYKTDENKDSILCFNIATVVEFTDSSSTSLNFLIPKETSDNRIFKINF